MHLLTTSSATLDEIVEPIDLRQPPGDIIVLSFADSDLAGLAAAWTLEREGLPSVRLAHLRDLRHPMSVDLWIDRIAVHAKVILVRLLGGLDWWRYGIERLTPLAQSRGIALAVLPGEDRDDSRLLAASTLPASELEALLAFFREGGRENLRAVLRRLARHAGVAIEAGEPITVPRWAGYLPHRGAVDIERLAASLERGRPVVPILFYRSLLLAANTEPIDRLCEALSARGLAAAPLLITSLKDPEAAQFVRTALARLGPAIIVAATAFGGGGRSEPISLGEVDVPVLQAVIATTKREAWQDSQRGLGAADLAMHVVLPEIDGRVLAGAIAFKDSLPPHESLAFTAFANRPEPDRIAFVADRVAGLARLQRRPRSARRIAVVMPDYPGVPGGTGYAVGLDVPASVIVLLEDLAQAGYTIDEAPQTSRELLDALDLRPPAVPARGSSHTGGRQDPLAKALRQHADTEAALALDDYARLLAELPADAVEKIRNAWGGPAEDSDVRHGAFRFRAVWFGNIVIALPPNRGRAQSRRADYHDATLPPRHALVAFGLWLRHVAKIDALVHMGAHGTIEWLPGKAVALTASCFPEAVLGAIPIFYPFIVSNPGEAALAKRRIGAVTIGHVPPPLVEDQLCGEARELELLVDEYAQADGLDHRRRERLAKAIVETAVRTGLAREAGVTAQSKAEEALRRIDAWLCDLKSLRIKDGLHVYGRVSAAEAVDPAWQQSAVAERISLIAALDGRGIAAGPGGSPARGRRDVLPTGRNLSTADPRTLPTPTAADLGRLAADEVVRQHLQTHGEMPRALVIDLWGSATLRTGGEEIVQGLALMGCRPTWDFATGRLTGIEALSIAAIGRPRIDVSFRISGLFRDLFPVQISLLDAAVRAVAAREEPDEENPLAAARRAAAGSEPAMARIFGAAPGAYGAGIEDLLGNVSGGEALGAAYLAAVSHRYGGAEGVATHAPGAFAARIEQADLLLHPSDDPGRDLLEGSADVGFIGGFAAAARLLGRTPDLVILDSTDPQHPRARPLAGALARVVRARAISRRFIAGQMRHGPRGAAELAETVDRLVAFADTTNAVPDTLFDLIYDAYVADPAVRDFLQRENPMAARAIADRLIGARHCGHWHPRRNDIETMLRALRMEAPP
jgi:cobaltochelatase CobN